MLKFFLIAILQVLSLSQWSALCAEPNEAVVRTLMEYYEHHYRVILVSMRQTQDRYLKALNEAKLAKVRLQTKEASAGQDLRKMDPEIETLKLMVDEFSAKYAQPSGALIGWQLVADLFESLRDNGARVYQNETTQEIVEFVASIQPELRHIFERLRVLSLRGIPPLSPDAPESEVDARIARLSSDLNEIDQLAVKLTEISEDKAWKLYEMTGRLFEGLDIKRFEIINKRFQKSASPDQPREIAPEYAWQGKILGFIDPYLALEHNFRLISSAPEIESSLKADEFEIRSIWTRPSKPPFEFAVTGIDSQLDQIQALIAQDLADLQSLTDEYSIGLSLLSNELLLDRQAYLKRHPERELKEEGGPLNREKVREIIDWNDRGVLMLIYLQQALKEKRISPDAAWDLHLNLRACIGARLQVSKILRAAKFPIESDPKIRDSKDPETQIALRKRANERLQKYETVYPAITELASIRKNITYTFAFIAGRQVSKAEIDLTLQFEIPPASTTPPTSTSTHTLVNISARSKYLSDVIDETYAKSTDQPTLLPLLKSGTYRALLSWH